VAIAILGSLVTHRRREAAKLAPQVMSDMMLPVLPTTVVGSYPQPDWLIDRDALLAHTPPRVRMREVWRVDERFLEAAQDDATRLAIADMERAGLDVLTDGEIRRESYFNRFATALSGIDIDRPGFVESRSGKQVPVPRVVGKVQRLRPVERRDAEFLRRHTRRPIKITLPGPFTMTQLAMDEHYGDARALAMDYADAVNLEARDLVAAGADFVQLDEPYLQAHPDQAQRYGVEAIDRALAGVAVPTIVHMCFGYAYVVKDKPSGYSFLPELDRCRAAQVSIEAAQPRLDLAILDALPRKTLMVGVLDLGDPEIETPDAVAARIDHALEHVAPERLVIAPDCGMKYLSRDVAFGKLAAMVEGTRRVRARL
jgi:5-methyltetrahydropteroyltriglutamate--homocysteine methyltransferase